MELLAHLGLYLILGFVLPGLCYLVSFAWCFPDRWREMLMLLPPRGKETTEDSWLFIVAVVSGLLLSTVAFAVEVGLRHYSGCFGSLFPYPNFALLNGVSGEHYANVLFPTAYMHFDIGLGLFVILVAYIVRALWTKQKASGGLAAILLILVSVNLVVSSELYRRLEKSLTNSSQIPPAFSGCHLD